MRAHEPTSLLRKGMHMYVLPCADSAGAGRRVVSQLLGRVSAIVVGHANSALRGDTPPSPLPAPRATRIPSKHTSPQAIHRQHHAVQHCSTLPLLLSIGEEDRWVGRDCGSGLVGVWVCEVCANVCILVRKGL